MEKKIRVCDICEASRINNSISHEKCWFCKMDICSMHSKTFLLTSRWRAVACEDCMKKLSSITKEQGQDLVAKIIKLLKPIITINEL